jgi:deazaflavin-dependent oxidoreductase (nitroreductase family)
MLEEIADHKPPRGFSRLLWRMPNWLFRLRVNRVLGERFLLLHHIGRKSGLYHENVLEVVRHDKASDTYYVALGWGDKSDWFRNVPKMPEVVSKRGAKIGSTCSTPTARGGRA